MHPASRIRIFAAALLLAPFLTHSTARADDAVDPSLIPDGTYPAHVDRVINSRRLEVTMQGTLKVFLASGRPSVTFNERVKANDDIVVTLKAGKVTALRKK